MFLFFFLLSSARVFQLITSRRTPSCSILFHFVPSHPIPSHSTPSHHVQSNPVPSHHVSCIIPSHPIPFHLIPFRPFRSHPIHPIPSHSIPSHPVPSHPTAVHSHPVSSLRSPTPQLERMLHRSRSGMQNPFISQWNPSHSMSVEATPGGVRYHRSTQVIGQHRSYRQQQTRHDIV